MRTRQTVLLVNRRTPMEYLVAFIVPIVDAVLDAESEICASTMLVSF